MSVGSFISNSYQKCFKRCFDVVFSTVAIFLLAPVFIVIGLVIWWDSGHVIFSHERVGYRGKKIRVYKFRTMAVDAERELLELLESDPSLRNEWEQGYKLQIDPRVTRIGRFLRKTKLDEIPQFLNVIKGDMSVVGPRPLTKEEFRKKLGSDTDIKLYQSVRPGITGEWQISGVVDYEQRIALELSSIRNVTFKRDISIIIRTIGTVVRVI